MIACLLLCIFGIWRIKGPSSSVWRYRSLHKAGDHKYLSVNVPSPQLNRSVQFLPSLYGSGINKLPLGLLFHMCSFCQEMAAQPGRHLQVPVSCGGCSEFWQWNWVLEPPSQGFSWKRKYTFVALGHSDLGRLLITAGYLPLGIYSGLKKKKRSESRVLLQIRPLAKYCDRR